MSGTYSPRTSRRRSALIALPALTALAAVTVLVASTATAVADPAAPSPAPSPSASPSPAPSGGAGSSSGSSARPGAGSLPAVCSTDANGHLQRCPQPVPATERPAGANNHATVTAPISDPAGLVDARTWTSGGGNTFPGAEAPFGMVQWSPDTMPNRSAGGGYNYGDKAITGYSLTHVSGPGCGAAEDLPMLPMTGALPGGNPNNVTTKFTNANEIAQAGFYSAQSNQPNTITSQFTATPHSSMARFTYPRTAEAGFLIKLNDSQNGEFAASTATVVNNHEVRGAETSGHFCGEANNDGQQQEYTVHFDVTFDHPFTAQVIKSDNGAPTAVYLTFDATSNPVVQAKVGISYVSGANAAANWKQENPGWDFTGVRTTVQQDWNALLGRIQISGGDYAHTQMFYSLLYKDFIQPNITSDVNGQYMGADLQVHTVGSGQHDQYGMYSGWDTYHSLAELQAMLDPAAAGDQAQSLINYYEQDQILQQWGYLNLNNYVMVGDPAQSIIADYYAFGAHGFDTATALQDMLKQATTTNDVRPGQNLQDQLGYLPEDGNYRSCCNPHGFVSSLLEYDSQDLALSFFAAALGDSADAQMLRQRANDWQNVFNPANQLLNPRNSDGSWIPGVTDTTTDRYVEGDAIEYLWNVPNDYAGLVALLGGPAKAAAALRTFLSQPNGYGEYAQLTNEFGFGEQYAPDYAGDPASTQRIVNNIRYTMYQPGPSLDNNDDLGANSSTFIWEMLGMYPENSGSDTLVFNSPAFPRAAITLPSGKRIVENAPGASPSTYYVQGLKLNGQSYSKLSVPFSTLAGGATLDWTLGNHPSSWGTATADAPPSYTDGLRPVIGYASATQVTVAPGTTTTATVGAQNATGTTQRVRVSVAVPRGSGLTVNPSAATFSVPPYGRTAVRLQVSASASAKQTFYSVPVSFSTGTTSLPGTTITVLVAAPGSLLRAFTNKGVSADSNVNAADFDGGGWSYSADALAAQNVQPGGPVAAGDITYTWPDVAPGYPDNAVADGQQVAIASGTGARQLGVLGSASGGNTQGLLTLRYSDHSTATFWLGLSDWTLGGGGGQVMYGNLDAVTTPYRNCNHCPGGRDSVNTHLFSAVVPVDPAKRLVGITLPSGTTGGELHVFAVGTSTAVPAGPVIDSITPGTAAAGDTVTIHGHGFGATQGNGYVQFMDDGVSWGAPGNAASLDVLSWSDTVITIQVPTPGGGYAVAPGTTAMVSVTDDAGATSDTGVLDITPTANPGDYYDNVGISADGDASCQADFDGDGYSYSANALAAAGVTRGSTVTVDGLHYTWPDVATCTADNILAHGQTILLDGASGASKLGVLGSSANGNSQGTITVTYTDGTSTQTTLYFTDWAQTPANGNLAAVTTPYRNAQNGGSQQITMYVDVAEIPLNPAKTVASVTFPSVSDHVSANASMHIFALTTGG